MYGKVQCYDWTILMYGKAGQNNYERLIVIEAALF